MHQNWRKSFPLRFLSLSGKSGPDIIQSVPAFFDRHLTFLVVFFAVFFAGVAFFAVVVFDAVVFPDDVLFFGTTASAFDVSFFP